MKQRAWKRGLLLGGGHAEPWSRREGARCVEVRWPVWAAELWWQVLE